MMQLMGMVIFRSGEEVLVGMIREEIVRIDSSIYVQ